MRFSGNSERFKNAAVPGGRRPTDALQRRLDFYLAPPPDATALPPRSVHYVVRLLINCRDRKLIRV